MKRKKKKERQRRMKKRGKWGNKKRKVKNAAKK